MKDIFALHTLVASNYISNCVVAYMAHMKLAAGVRKHGQAVELFFIGIFTDLKGLVVGPILLRVPFYGGGIIMLFDGHEDSLLLGVAYSSREL